MAVNIYAGSSYKGKESRSQTRVMLTWGLGYWGGAVAASSIPMTEAEYIADCDGLKYAACIAQFLEALGIKTKPTLVKDSEGAYNLSQASKFARWSRHIDHRYHNPNSKCAGNGSTIPRKEG